MEPIILLVLLAVLALPLIFSARRQKRQMRETQQLQNSLVVGDRVMTTSGIYGTVTELGDEDVELEIAPDVYTTWLRAAIRKRVEDGVIEDEDDDEDLAQRDEDLEDLDDPDDYDEGYDRDEPAAEAPARSDRA